MIGLFDSGSGGLTILDALQKRFPDQAFLYLGDHARAPYGHRSTGDILRYTEEGVDLLIREGASLVILACNTAAATALRHLQQQWLPEQFSTVKPSDRPNILGVLVPMVEAVTEVVWDKTAPNLNISAKDHVLLFATRKTIQSGAYREEVAKRAPNIRWSEVACPGVVDAIEGGAGLRPLEGLIRGYIADAFDQFGPPDKIILGCTHFPIVENIFKQALMEKDNGKKITLFSQPFLVAESTAAYLNRHPVHISDKSGETRILTTGDLSTVSPWLIPLLQGRHTEKVLL